MDAHETILKDIKAAVLSVDANANVLLFGSRARGDYKEESDWDVLILTNDNINDAVRLEYIGALLPLEIKYVAAINPVIKNKVEWRMQANSDLFVNIQLD